MPRKPVGNTFLKTNDVATFFGEPLTVGERCTLDQEKLVKQEPQVYLDHPNGRLWVGDSIVWLRSLEPESVDLVFADPPYNIGKADWDQFDSHDDYVSWSLSWIELAARVLKQHGSLYVCGFSEILADLRRPAAKYFRGCKWVIWFYKNKANLGNDWGRSHESIIHFRKSKEFTFNADSVRIPYGNHTLKYPVHPQAESSQYAKGKPGAKDWTPHPRGAKPKDVFEIPVTSNGMAEKTPHPTQKPEELLRKLILASSNQGDLVMDPFAGSGTTLVCAEQLRRRWAGCDTNPEYCSWAAIRLQRVPNRPVENWVELDRSTAERRESIR
jgi:site-specific DNA-methyltransferase (adenine-specific)